MSRRKQPASAAAPLAYSYQRFSSPAQAEGDSLRRQAELRDAWLAKMGTSLDKSLSMTDEGVSAFTGSHRDNPDRSALAAFLELVRRGRIPRGSYLIVESLDRLTREHIRPALTLLLNLIEQGIRIVQLLPAETIYDENVDPMALMLAIMELNRGHAESAMKSQRLGRAWREKKKRAAAGEPMTRACPSWIRVEGGRFVLVPDRAAAVRRVFALANAGYGLAAITKKLNTDRVAPIGRGKMWAKSYVHKLLSSRSTFGEFQPHQGHIGPDRKPDGPPIPNYFPAVIDEQEWHAAQAALSSRRQKAGRTSTRVNIFSGLLYDARDGGSMHVVNKGDKSSGPALVSYKAAQGVPGSKYAAFPLETFERAVLSQLREINPAELLPEHDAAADRVTVLTGRHADLEARVAKIQALLRDGGDLAPLVEVLRQVDAERATVGDELAQARREAASPLATAWGDARSLLNLVDDATDKVDARLRLRAAVRRIVDRVTVLVVPRGEVRLCVAQFWFRPDDRSRLYVIWHRKAQRIGPGQRREPSWGVWSGLPPIAPSAEDAAIVEKVKGAAKKLAKSGKAKRAIDAVDTTAPPIDLRRPDDVTVFATMLERLDLSAISG